MDYREAAKEYELLLWRQWEATETQDSGLRSQDSGRTGEVRSITSENNHGFPDFCLPTAEPRPFLDVGKFGLFRLRQFVDFTNVGVGKFLHLVETVALIIFRDFFVFQHFL